jgi:hypothetical protein
VSPAVTSADPLLTRLAIGRSNDGSQFGMFMQVFADGTVIDSEGVHRLRRAELKPLVDVVQSGDLLKLRGHCGAPSTDFTEYVHIVVYERRLGRLTAHAFSYSGNTQGCDHAIRHLHAALETLQMKLSRQPGPGDAATPAPVGPAQGLVNPTAGSLDGVPSLPVTGEPIPPPIDPTSPLPSGPVIPLTPAEPSR